MKSFFSRTGGKSNTAKDIIKLFPENYDIYCEPFFGAGSVFFRKPIIDKVEIINDLDTDVYKIMKLVQSRNINNSINRAVTYEYFEATKHSKKPIHLLELNKSSFGGKGKTFRDVKGQYKQLVSKTDYSVYTQRLKDVIILNDNFEDVIKHYDSKKTFFFLDPPYENERQRDYKDYVHPEEVLNVVKSIKGKFLLTYNDSPKIRHLFSGYRIRNNSVMYQNTQYIPKRNVNELIITNY